MDDDQRLGAVRDRLLERYLGFAFGGLHFQVRDISAEIAQARQMMAEFLGREPQMPHRRSRLLHLWVVTDATNEIVGSASREVGLRGPALVVAHKRLRLRPEWRRRGFGSALLSENRDWYRECGVESIVLEAEGDGSAFAAVRGFDFDVLSYAGRPGFAGLSEQEVRCVAIDRLMRHAAIANTAEDGEAPPRESVDALLQRLVRLGPEPAEQVAALDRRLPRVHGPGQAPRDGRTFIAPHELAAFGRDRPLEALGGAGLGSAVLARTGWSAISTL